MADELLTSPEKGVLALTINRPDRRNALNNSVLTGMRRAMQQAAQDPSVRVVTITGSGERVFCAGADLKASLSGPQGGEGFSPEEYRELLVAILRFPKPTVALARGHVMAGGLGVLLACDLALACDDVHFSTPEIQVGMFPMMVLALLFRHVGPKMSAEMLFLGERLSAADAMSSGIVNRIYPREQFETESARIVLGLAEKSSMILQLGKEAIRDVTGRSLGEDLDYLEGALARVMACPDSREGLQAFLEKRRPLWK